MAGRYDHIICGAGAAGLLLAYRMAQEPFFQDQKILLLDKDLKNTNDRTWCFWEQGKGEWDELLFKQWDHASFKSEWIDKTFLLKPYTYKMLRSKTWYQHLFTVINEHPNITFKQSEILNIKENEKEVLVTTKDERYRSVYVYNSIFSEEKIRDIEKFPLLRQHFIGWFIKTEKPVFDDSTVGFMDFKVPQEGNTRFMYVLPTSKTEALFEYTLFSENLLPTPEYEVAIEAYLKDLGISNYTIIEKERGNIPMSCYPFQIHNTSHLIHIGTAGGWTKPSTGFTFMNTLRQTDMLIAYLKQSRKDLSTYHYRTKFWYYDLLFLDVLFKRNDLGAKIFSTLFEKNRPKKIFKFLDEKTSFFEDIRIMFSLPKKEFVKALFKRLF